MAERLVASNHSTTKTHVAAIAAMEATERSDAYKNQSMKILKKEFPILSVEAIVAASQASDYDFTESFRCLTDLNAALFINHQ